MASARARHAFRDDDSDDDSPHQAASHRQARRQLDSSGDEGPARQAPIQRRPLTSAGGRLKYGGSVRPDDSGDLRPTTPPAGPNSRTRQADWASAVLQMLQNSALIAGQTHPAADMRQQPATGSASSKASRRAPAAGGSSQQRGSIGMPSTSSAKVAAARKLDNSSSEDEERVAITGHAPALLHTVTSMGQSELKAQAQPTSDARGLRSSRAANAGSIGTTAPAASVASSRFTSNPGHAPTGGSGGGGLAAAAAAAVEGLQAQAAQSAAYRQQQRASRLRRVSGNDSVASEVSHPESLASSKQTLGSSRLSTTVQRVVARQRLLESSSGEEEGDPVPPGQHLDSDVGQAVRLLARFKSLSSLGTGPGLALAGTSSSPPGGSSISTNGRKSPTAPVAMIPASTAPKDRTGSSSGAAPAALARPSSAAGSTRVRAQPAFSGGQAVRESGAFTFTAAQGAGSSASDGISPRMRQAAAAAAAEVSAAAASSLRPLPLTTIVPARLTSPVRPQTAPQQPRNEPHRAASMASTEEGAGGFATASGATAARQDITALPQPNKICHNSQRITTWLEQQPSISSAGITDDIASEYATTMTGTDVDLDRSISPIKAIGRRAGAMLESIMSGDTGTAGPGAPPAAHQRAASRSRAIRLTISSDEEEDGCCGGSKGCKTAADIVETEGRMESRKKIATAVKESAAGIDHFIGDAAARPAASTIKGAQAAPAAATAATATAARRLEFAGTATASPRLAKELTSTYSSPSFRASESQSPDNAPSSPPSDGLQSKAAGIDDVTLPRQAPAVCGAPAIEASACEHLPAATLGSSPQQQHSYAREKIEGQHLTATTESSSPDSLVRIGSGGGGQHGKAPPVAGAARLTPNELRVMLSVLSRPTWTSGAGASSGPAAASSSLSPRPSQGGESVQSFTYSEMLQVMRAMSSSGGDGSGSPSKASAAGHACDGSARASRLHKSSGRRDEASEAPCAAPRPPKYQQQQAQQQAIQQRHEKYHHMPRSARELPTSHTSLEVKASHSARSFDESSTSSLLGEHPMAAPFGRDWSASASTVSGRGCAAEEEQQQRDFAEMVRLWTLLTGRQVPAESVAERGRGHLSPEGSTSPRSGRLGPGSILSGAGTSGTHPSAAALAASAAAMATSAVMAAAGCAHQFHPNAYPQAAHLHPFSESHGIASAASLSSQNPLVPHHDSLTAAASAKSRSTIGAPCARTGLPGDAPQPQQDSDESARLARLLGDAGPASIQVDLVRLIRLLSAAGRADLLPAEASEATKSDLGRVVDMLRSSVDAAPRQEGSPVRKRAAVTEDAERKGATSPSPGRRMSHAAATTTSPVEGRHTRTESSPTRRASSRRSSSDTVETGLALGRLYQSLRNLRVRDEADQTEGGERLKAETTSGCVQTEAVIALEPASREMAGGVAAHPEQAESPLHNVSTRRDMSPRIKSLVGSAKTTAQGAPESSAGASRLSVLGDIQPAQEPLAALSNFVGKEIRVTRALKLPTGELVELEPLLALASDGAPLSGVSAEVQANAGQWLQELRALNTSSTTPTWCTSPSTTDGGVQSDPAALAPTSTQAAQHQPQAGASASNRPSSDAEASLSASTDSAGGVGTCVTVAPAITPAAAQPPLATSLNPQRLSVQGAAAVFQLRNLPIASEGGIMDAPNQEAVTAGRVGSAGGMLAYLEAADPTTATALLELVQALQLMTLHSRRRRWISDGSSTASGAYLVEPLDHPSLGGSSVGATTLRYSFGTSIGPSVSQAGHASLIDLPDAVMQAPAAVPTEVASPAGKAATTGGLGAASGTAGRVAQPKRHTNNAALPPRPAPNAGAEPTARHLRRALRAVSGGGTVRVTPGNVRERFRGGAGGGGSVPVSDGRAVPAGLVAEAAKLHIVRALELLSQPISGADASNASVRAAAADAELRAQEELVAALMALLAPEGAAIQATEDKGAEDGEVGGDEAGVAASQHSASLTLAAPSPRTHELQAVVSAAAPALSTPETQPPTALAPTADCTASQAASPTKSSDTVPPMKPASPLQARIQEVLAKAERASAGVSSLQVGLSPTAPEAAEVLDGVPFEQAIGFIMDGLRDFDGGPSQLARHLHLMYAPSNGGCGGVGVFYPTALESVASRRHTYVALSAAAALEAATASDSGTVAVAETGSEEPQPLTDAERQRMQTLVSEAVAAAEALARGVRRDEVWNAERLGLPMEVDFGDAQHQEEPSQAASMLPAQLPVAPMATQLPVPSLALTRASNSWSSSPARHTYSRPRSNGSGAAVSKLRFSSAGSSTQGTAAEPLLAQRSLPVSPTDPDSAVAVPSPRRLIGEPPVVAAGAIGGSSANTQEADSRLVTSSVQQRSAPVTTAGVVDLLTYGVPVAQSPGTYVQPSCAPQTFGGAMDLPEDSAVDAAVPQTKPYLPYGDLDEQLMPIRPNAVDIAPPEGQWSAAETCSNSLCGYLQPQQEVQPLVQSPSPAAQSPSGQAMPSATRLPTFAMPSAPAVRGPQEGLQSATAGGAMAPLGSAVVLEPSRLVNTYGGMAASGALVAAVGANPQPAEYQGHQRRDEDDSSEEGWESDMAGAARICSPEADPSAVASFTVGHAPSAQQPHSLMASPAAASPAPDCSSPAAAPGQPQPHSPLAHQPPPHITSIQTREPSAGGVGPEVPALTAMDRFRSPRPSHSASAYRSVSPARPTSGAPSNTHGTRGSALTGAETISAASLEVQPQQSSQWSPGSGSDARGGFPSVRLARDALSSRGTPHVAGDIGAEEYPALSSVSVANAAAEISIEVDAGNPIMEIEVMEEGNRARRALFSAACEEAAPDMAGGADDQPAETVSPAVKTEQLLAQASELLLQAMQRAAEGQPEQEAAFRILAPILASLATASDDEASPEAGQQLLALSAEQRDAHVDTAATCQDTTGLGASFTSDGITVLQSFHQHEHQAAPDDQFQAQHQQHLATAADLESFKEDVMAGVRSALMEIVDMIGARVGQYTCAAATGAPTSGPTAAGPAIVAGDWTGDQGDWESLAGVRPAESIMTPERSASPYLAPELGQQEIRITRAELEAFLFGRAVLNRNAADELLGMRLREMYASAPQSLQGDEDEPVGSGKDAGSIASNDPRAGRGHGGSSVSSSATATFVGGQQLAGTGTAGNYFGDNQRRGPPASPTRFESADAAAQGPGIASSGRPGTCSPPVPRDSQLRQPVADGADFKSLFRRSIEHLRSHLQPSRCPSPAVQGAIMAAESNRVPPPLPRAPVPRPPGSCLVEQGAAAPDAGLTVSELTFAGEAVTASSASMEATLSPAGMSLPLAQQLAAAAAAAATTADNDDDVELDVHLSGGLQPECTRGLARCPDPAAPATQSLSLQPHSQRQVPLHVQAHSRSQPQSRRGTGDAHAEVGAIGDFLMALAEPVVQVVGVLAQPGSSRPLRSVVIEELSDEHPHPRLERPSRVPGFAATTSGAHVVLGVDDDDRDDADDERLDCAAAFGHSRSIGHGGIAQMSTPRAVSEANLSGLHLREAALEQQYHPQLFPVVAAASSRATARTSHHMPLHLQMSRSASCTPVQRTSAAVTNTRSQIGVVNQDPQPQLQAHRQQPDSALGPTSALLTTVQHPQTQVRDSQPLLSGPVRLKMTSAPGSGPLPAEDRPLSSFMSPSDSGAVTTSPPRRRTHSPGPLTRQVTHPAETRVSALPVAHAVGVVGSPRGTSLDELEGFLRAFRTRIGTDETGDGQPPQPEPQALRSQHQQALALQHPLPLSGHALHASGMPEVILPSPGLVGATANGEHGSRNVLSTDMVAVPLTDAGDMRRNSNLTESVSVNTARRVMTGFNIFSIRASGASALAAAAAVEQTFSPRNKQEDELTEVRELPVEPAQIDRGAREASVLEQPAAEDCAGVAPGPSDASHGSSSATPTNPLLREHLEHFQALLEKANDLVDRLMLADEDLASEGADPNATPSPSATAGGSAARRQLSFRPRSSSTSVTPRRQIASVPSALAPGTPVDADGGATVTPVASALPQVPSLDPELAALFPATAARLARPYAHVQQTPDAACSLLSSAVSAVPQLAAGADRVRSLSCTPSNRSPAASISDLRIAPMNSASDAAPSSAAGTVGHGVATPLALVAALLAEAHSRMEFRSLEEQRGADRVLSALLDEHFAHVLGTPRGFLTPQRGPTVRNTATALVEAVTPQAPAVQPLPSVEAPPVLHDQLREAPKHQLLAIGPAHVSSAFSRAFATAAEAEGFAKAAPDPGDGRLPASASKSSQERSTRANGSSEAGALPPNSVRPQQPSSPVVPRDATGGGAQQAVQQRADDMKDFLAQVMKQRSDILTSALDHVHRASATAATAPPLPAAAAVTAAGASAQPATAAPPGPPMAVLGLPEAFVLTPPLEAAETGAGIDAHLPNSVIPADSDGLTLMPQPLMPYQELDSDSAPTSYNVSIAGSAFQGEASATWSRVPSPRDSTVFPSDPTAPLVRQMSCAMTADAVSVQLSSQGAQAKTVHRGTSDSAVTPTSDDVPEALAVAEVQKAAEGAAMGGGYDLSHLIDDDDGTLSAGPSSVFQHSTLSVARVLDSGLEKSSLGGEYGYDHTEYDTSGRPSTLRTSSTAIGSHSHVPEGPVPPDVSALRYNPIYDPFGSVSGGGASVGVTFGVPAAAAGSASAEASNNFSDGGAFAAASSMASGTMTTLHHETTYTPLALAAGDGTGAGEGGGATSLHARLRSAGGTSTAVLVPNPTFDDPADLDRHSPAIALSATAAAVKAAGPSGPKPAATVEGDHNVITKVVLQAEVARVTAASDAATSYPRRKLEFPDVMVAGSTIGQGTASSSSSSNNVAGVVLPLSPVDAMASPLIVSFAALPAPAGTNNAAGPKRASGAISDILPRSDPGDSAADSMDLSSLLANSLTESQLNLLSVAPELPSGSHSALPQYPATAHRLQHQLQLSAGGASTVSTVVARPVQMTAVASGGGTSMDVTMSLDFEEISREAAAVAETLSAHASAEVPAGLVHGSAAAPTGAPLPSAALATAATSSSALLSVTAPSAPAAATAEGDHLATKQVMTSPAAQKRPMGDVVAAAVRRFESGACASGVPAEQNNPAPESPSAEPADLALHVAVAPRRSSSSGIPRGPPSPGGAKLAQAVDSIMSAGASSDWQSVSLSTGVDPRNVAAEETGVQSGGAADVSGETLGTVPSGVRRSTADETSPLTVLTREWVPKISSQEISAELLDPVQEQQPALEADEQAAVEEQQPKVQAANMTAGTVAAAGSSASPAAKQLVKGAIESPRTAGRASPARQPLWHAGTASSSATPVTGRHATASPGSNSNASPTASGRQANVRGGAGASAGSQGGARSASVTSNASVMRRATQSPLRTAPPARAVRPSVPGAQAELVKKWR